MNHDKNIKKGLQKDVALEPSLKANHKIAHNHISQPFLNKLTGKQDDTSARLRDTVNQHKTILPGLPSSSSGGEESEEAESPLEKAANKVAGKALSAATGGALPPELAEKVVELSKKHKTLSQRILEFLGLFPKIITDNPVLSKIVLSFCISGIAFILLILIATGISEEIKKAPKRVFTQLILPMLTGDAEIQAYIIDLLRQEEICNSKTDCKKEPAYQFLTTFQNKNSDQLKKYNKLNKDHGCGSELQILESESSLLIGTIFFNRDDELLSSELEVTRYEQEMDYLIEALYIVDSSTHGKTCYNISHDAYKDAIVKENGYIDRFRSDLGESLSYASKLQIYESILDEINEFMEEPSKKQSTYVACSGITIVDKDKNIIGTYSLEDYVAGVLSGEMYGDFPMESQKALAVAARTYVLAHTNSCQNPIESSSNRQNFNSDIKSFARDAASATAGQILVNSSGNIFATEYDSWNCKGETTCTYQKKPNGEIHEVTISNKYLNRASGGHGRGMSQIAAADMADQGMGYEAILKFFYSDGVQLSNLTAMSGSMNGTKYTSTAPLHSSVDTLWGNRFYNPYAQNVGQCVWYARSRAQEILYYSNMPDTLKTNAINSIKNTIGDGGAWFQNPDGSLFAKSTNVNQPRAGAIVSWSGGIRKENTNYYYGHVAIIESVNADGTVTISEGWKTSKDNGWESTSWSTVNYRTFTATIDYIQYHVENGQQYYFNGYVYLLG